jgi:hypothetical protein
MLCIKKISLGFETLTLQVKNTYVLKILKQFKKIKSEKKQKVNILVCNVENTFQKIKC